MRIGIIGAMNEEIDLMKSEMEITGEVQYASVTFYVGNYKGRDIVLCKSGVGKVNAAITTQVLIDHFSVDDIIFTGVAGALDPDLDIGDVVVSTSAQQHDIDASALGFERGIIPMFEHPSVFPAAHRLAELAISVSKELDMEGKVVLGKVMSGDQFIADHNIVTELHDKFAGTCVEMEGSAVAQVSMLNDVPYVIIRSISDKANGEANVTFTEFVQIAAKQSNQIVTAMLENMKPE